MSAFSFLACSGCCGRDKGAGRVASGDDCTELDDGRYQNGAPPSQPIRELEEWEKYKQIQKHDEWGQPMFDEWHTPIMEWEVGEDGNYVKLTVQERCEMRKLYGMYMEEDQIQKQQQQYTKQPQPSHMEQDDTTPQQQIRVLHTPSMNEPLLQEQQWHKQPPSQPSSQPSSPPLSAYEIFQSPAPSPGSGSGSGSRPSVASCLPLQHHPSIQHVRELEEWEKYKQRRKKDQWGQPMYDEGGAPTLEWELDGDGNYIELTVEERREIRKLYGMYTEKD